MFERDIELTLVQKKVVRRSRSIATENSCPVETFCGQLLEKAVCFHLSLSLLNETPKGQSFRLKVVEDPKVLFDRCRNLVSW